MSTTSWGLLGPESLSSQRRTRTLGVGASVRLFNDLAVPGLGGVWFGKELLLATLGIVVAEDARSAGAAVRNIEAANAVEALACWLAFQDNKWGRDARLRGNSKLQNKALSSFKTVRQPNFYVTQPMRMATVQALPALGFVEHGTTRFNGFTCSAAGRDFVERACADFLPFKTKVTAHLGKWLTGATDRIDSPELRKALSPLHALPGQARAILRDRLRQGDQRRCNALEWVERLTTEMAAPQWQDRPSCIDAAHWEDLRAGALFFKTRDAAAALLDALEAHMVVKATGEHFSLRDPVPDTVAAAVATLRHAALKFLALGHGDLEANRFCRDCSDVDEISVLAVLVRRDGQVLRLVGEEVLPGLAFGRGAGPVSDAAEDAEVPTGAADIPLPEGVSHRVRNLYLLNLDLHDKLHDWLSAQRS